MEPTKPTRHKLLSKDTESRTGVCARCGPVSLRWKSSTQQWRCAVGLQEQKGRPKYRNSPVRTLFKLDDDVIQQMLEEQNYKCAICPKAINVASAVDHCHKTMTLRKILCGNCNTGLGMFNDNVEILYSAIRYLQVYTGTTPTSKL